MLKKIIASSAIACMLCACMLPTPAIATTGAQGLAVYRDGVPLGADFEWHAAIMYYGAGGAKVQPSEITDLRCDGVIEYCYEYNDVRIFGSDTYWNISVRSIAHTNAHACIWPQNQAQNYMSRVSPDKP